MATVKNDDFLCTWKIENYSFSFQKCGQCIRSPLFKARNLGGSDWTLLLYPRGDCRFMATSVTCILYRYQFNEGDESEEKITIDIRFELESSTGNAVKICEFKNQEILRGKKSTPFQLIKIDKLQDEMELWPVDTLILRCYLIKTHDVLPLVPREIYYSSCEACTEVCVDNIKQTWIIRIPETPEWFRKTEIIFSEMLPIVICFKVIGDCIRLEICSTSKYKYSRFISCVITFLDSNGVEICNKTYSHLFFNDTKEFHDIIQRSILDHMICEPNNDIKLKIDLSSTNETIFSRINYNSYGVNGNKPDKSQLPSVELKRCLTSAETNSLLCLQESLKDMFTVSKFTDMELRTDDNIFSAHKAILAARSPVFCAMFEHGMIESKTGVVEINDVEPKILKCFLEYLYSGTVDEMDDEMAMNLLVVADKYEILSLKDVCSGYLRTVLSLKNVCDVLLVADMINDGILKSASIDYIVRKYVKVLPSPEWSTWVQENVELATEIFLKLSQKLDKDSNSLHNA